MSRGLHYGAAVFGIAFVVYKASSLPPATQSWMLLAGLAGAVAGSGAMMAAANIEGVGDGE